MTRSLPSSQNGFSSNIFQEQATFGLATACLTQAVLEPGGDGGLAALGSLWAVVDARGGLRMIAVGVASEPYYFCVL